MVFGWLGSRDVQLDQDMVKQYGRRYYNCALPMLCKTSPELLRALLRRAIEQKAMRFTQLPRVWAQSSC